MSETSLPPDQIHFTNAFNAHRHTLTQFATCSNLEELRVVRDGFLLGLSSDLCPDEYEPVRIGIITDPTVADATGTDGAFRRTVESARKCDKWDDLMTAVRAKAMAVGSDLDDIWAGLENGRLEWLSAASSAHGIKTTLKSALDKDGGGTDGDVSDAKMVWMYSLSLSIPSLKEESGAWQRAVKMKDGTRPLVGYDATLWDCRREEWPPLDLGVQAAAERGGSSIEEAWRL